MTDLLSDRQAVVDVLSRYAHGLDDGDVACVLACFMPDAVADYDGGSIRMTGHVELKPFFERALTAPSTHMIGNTIVKMDGDRAATRSSAVAYVTRIPDQVTMRGLVYETRCVRSGSTWRFSHLLHRSTWQCAVPAKPGR